MEQVKRKYKESEVGSLVPLDACPIGLFDFKGTLYFKTARCTAEKCDAYEVVTGKAFKVAKIGDEELMRVMVRSVKMV